MSLSATERMSQPAVASASNALYNGEANGFEHACRLAERAAHEEASAMRRLRSRYQVTPTHDALAEADAYDRSLDDYAAKARLAATIWRDVHAAIQPAIVERLLAAGLEEFADALSSGDWSKLAI